MTHATTIGVVSCTRVAASLLACWLGGCAELGESGDGQSDESLPSDVKFLDLTDDSGVRYQLPYRSKLSPSELAANMGLDLLMEDGRAVALTPVVPAIAHEDRDQAPEADAIELWPIRQACVTDEPGLGCTRQGITISGIKGASASWVESFSSGKTTYSIDNVRASVGTLVIANGDYDLYSDGTWSKGNKRYHQIWRTNGSYAASTHSYDVWAVAKGQCYFALDYFWFT